MDMLHFDFNNQQKSYSYYEHDVFSYCVLCYNSVSMIWTKEFSNSKENKKYVRASKDTISYILFKNI